MTEDEVERYCHEQIALIHEEARLRAKPFVSQLIKLYSMRPLPPLVIDVSNIDPAILAAINGKS